MAKAATSLVELFHHRWAVPLLAELAVRGGGGRVTVLTRALGASRGGVRQAITSLTEMGFVDRNRGHGHPLRPEYVLTDRGRIVAAETVRIVGLTRDWSIQDLAFRKWPLPVVHAMGETGARFSRLRGRLPGVTDRALSNALQALGTIRLADRIVQPSRPPRVRYLPTDRAHQLLPPLRAIGSGVG